MAKKSMCSKTVFSEQQIELLSSDRLIPFARQASTSSEAIEFHNKAMRLNGAILSTIGMIEIVLRNKIYVSIEEIANENWLQNTSRSLQLMPNELSAIQLATKRAKNLQRTKYRRKRSWTHQSAPPQSRPNDGQIITQLTFHFWKKLFSKEYEERLWKTCLKKVFPNKTYSRADIAIQLEQVYQARNRVAHHEFIYGYRLSKVLEAIDFIAQNLGEERPSRQSPAARLVRPHLDSLRTQADEFHAILWHKKSLPN